MVSDEMVRRWEAAYSQYGLASELVGNSEPGNPTVARQMAQASGNVALVWRQMASEPNLPWWSVAALSAAAQAFEHQARDWAARASYDVEVPTGGRRAHAHKDVYPVAFQRRSEEAR